MVIIYIIRYVFNVSITESIFPCVYIGCGAPFSYKGHNVLHWYATPITSLPSWVLFRVVVVSVSFFNLFTTYRMVENCGACADDLFDVSHQKKTKEKKLVAWIFVDVISTSSLPFLVFCCLSLVIVIIPLSVGILNKRSKQCKKKRLETNWKKFENYYFESRNLI